MTNLKISSNRVDVLDEDGLDPGDSIEFSLTHEVELPDGMKMWAKFGVSSCVRESEDSNDAANRIATYVMNQIASKIRAAVAHASTIA